MRLDKTKCDRCGKEKDNPTPYIHQVTIKFKRITEQVPAVDWSGDMCVGCFDAVQDAVQAVMKSG